MLRSTSREIRAIIIDLIKYNAHFTFGMFVVYHGINFYLRSARISDGWRKFYFSHGNQGLK